MINNKKLGVFAITMINIIAVDSLRTLPFSAAYGMSLIFYYLLAALVFFLPLALVSAELATAWPGKGGIYVWVREAFGERWAFAVIWLQWVYNIVWYPTILAFVGAMMAYLINPALADSKTFMLSVILITFWLATLMNFSSIRISSFISTLGALFGTLLPMLFITLLGVCWMMGDSPMQLSWNWQQIVPDFSHIENLSFLLAVLFGLIGIEVSASHADEVRQPEKVFPRAIAYSSVIIIFSLVLSSLAIAVVVPQKELNIVTGLVQAFAVFFNSYHLSWALPIVVALMVLGSVACIATWVIGPTKGLLVAARDGSAPPVFAKMNRFGSPYVVLLIQAVVCSLLSLVFLLMPSVSSSYWLLTAMTAQLAMLVYVALFAAAIRLRYKRPDTKRAYMIPGGKPGLWGLCLLGMASCLFAIVLDFVPPAQVSIGSWWQYELILTGGLTLFALPPFIIYQIRKPEWQQESRLSLGEENLEAA